MKKIISNHVAVVVDSSGSMHSLRGEAIKGMQNQIATLRDHGADQKSMLTLMAFSTCPHEPLVNNMDVNDIPSNVVADYSPSGRTALLDAIGATIKLLETTATGEDADAGYLVHIISDGMENNSRNWTWQRLRSKITDLQDSGRWTFTFLGANQNVQEVGERLGIPAGNLEKFQTTRADFLRAADKMHDATRKHLQDRRAGRRQSADLMEEKPEKPAMPSPPPAPRFATLGPLLDRAVPDPRNLIRTVAQRNTNPGSHCHGPDHWKCVAVTGLRLLKATPEADPIVVLLFALLHDSQRNHDGGDRGHGHRAAALAIQLHHACYHLIGSQLDQLVHACFHHNGGKHAPDPTVAVCWDADRLNLWRVGTTPDPARLFTEAGRDPALIAASAAHVREKFSWRDIFAAYRNLPRLCG